MAKLEHYEAENHCYFVTTTTEGRSRIFADKANCEILCNLLFSLRSRGKMLLLGFVVMPDHVHLLVVPQGETGLSEIIR
ncbi:MAG: transposase, partial [Dehalococcoidia bacterium]|nr:transposase [Dehalococcoidia bacterium]